MCDLKIRNHINASLLEWFSVVRHFLISHIFQYSICFFKFFLCACLPGRIVTPAAIHCLAVSHSVAVWTLDHVVFFCFFRSSMCTSGTINCVTLVPQSTFIGISAICASHTIASFIIFTKERCIIGTIFIISCLRSKINSSNYRCYHSGNLANSGKPLLCFLTTS